ncbi:pitrilysin family protein [Frigidibacter sp. RF13]|uniref:M16 family metallopeptidase n=1 Tax=Frigidibacter sp. RF13 TaxID=2997340 RepID=UPI00226FAB24|nr:pitrilysin family protein [Frigidibacter sp. RF13]MCY1128312.1 pitrilysin family protein [Frigidibacter sp. RF13]
MLRLSCGLALGLLAAPAALSSAAFADEVTTFTLDNGMQAVVIEDHRAPVVTHMVWYRAGSADERRGTSGIAHFLEHLMFKGTDAVPDGQFSQIVEAQGGYDNAFTSSDQTAYFQRLAADRLELVMRMEADRMRNLTLTEEDVATEREVILEERAQRIDSSPEALFSEQMDAAQYLNHPYGTPNIGWRAEMAALSRQDALDWYGLYYAPNNAILIVAGDVDPAEVKALAEKYYAPLAPSAGVPERARPAEPPQLAERRLSFSDPNIAQPYVTRRYLAPERDAGAQEEAAALVFLAALLGGNAQTSLLSRALTFEQKIAVSAGAGYDATSLDDTTFGLYAVPAPGVSLSTVEAAMDKVLDDLLKNGVDPAQFARLKTQMKAELIYRRDNVGDLAEDYGAALTSGLTIADVEAWPDVLQKVTAEDVITVARKVLDRRHAVTGWAMRTGAEEKLP